MYNHFQLYKLRSTTSLSKFMSATPNLERTINECPYGRVRRLATSNVERYLYSFVQ